MNQKIVTREFIQKFYDRYSLLSQILQDLIREVGHAEVRANGQSVVDPKQLRPGITQSDPRHVSTQHDKAITLPSGINPANLHTIVKIGDKCLFQNPTGVEGMFQHLRQKTLFFALDPTEVVQQNAIPTFYREREVDSVVDLDLAKKKHITNMINRAYTQSGKKAVTVLLLDQPNNPDNLSALYNKDTGFRPCDQPWDDKDNDDLDGLKHLIKKANVGETIPTSFDVKLYLLDAGEDKKHRRYINLSSKGLEQLYDIYAETIGHLDPTATKADPFPILIYSTDGLNLAPQIALAFDLLYRFDEIFLAPKERLDMNKMVYEAYRTLQRSFSPHALCNVDNLTQAFHIAFVLKMIELQRQCIKQLTDYREDKKNVEGFDEITPTIARLLKIANDKTISYQNKAPEFSHIRERNKRALSSPLGFKFIPRITFPEHYTLITTLHEALRTRAKIENGSLNTLDPRPPEARQEVLPATQPRTISM